MKIGSCLVVGCGGLGTYLIPPLVRLLTYHPNGTNNIVICDKDKYEPKNYNRQIFELKNQGINKAAALGKTLNLPSLITYQEYINYENVTDVFAHCLTEPKLVIAAVDNAATRKLLAEQCNDYFKDYILINTANGYHTIQVSVELRLDNKVPFTSITDRYSNIANPDDDIPGGDCINEAVSSPQLLSANVQAASTALSIVTCILDSKDIYPEYVGEIYKGIVKGIGEVFDVKSIADK